VLIYDGDCGFCTATANWVDERPGSNVDVQPWQSLDLDAYGLTVDDVTSAAYWVDPSGELHRGHRAVARTLVSLGGPLAIVGRVLGVPPVSWLAALGYRLVAANRYRLPGATCAIPQQR
jgi:predicted DCC family thiol-disulfide oxidoreductase YuxK